MGWLSRSRAQPDGTPSGPGKGSQAGDGPAFSTARWQGARDGTLVQAPYTIVFDDAGEAVDVTRMLQHEAQLLATDTRNFPRSCPFLHQDIARDFPHRGKRAYVSRCFKQYWMLLGGMALHAVASLLTSTLAPITNVGATTMAFVTLFLGVFGLYFLHFRVVYWALRKRSGILGVLYIVGCVALMIWSIYVIADCISNIATVISPLAPGSPLPVKANPMVAVVALAVDTAWWLFMFFFLFKTIRMCIHRMQMPLTQEANELRLQDTPAQSGARAVVAALTGRTPSDMPIEAREYTCLWKADGGLGMSATGTLLVDTHKLAFTADSPLFDNTVQDVIAVDHVQHLQTVGKVGLHVQFVRHEYSFGSLGTEAAPRKRGGRVPAETRLFEFRTKQLRDEVLEHAKRAVSNSKSDNYVPSREEMRQLRDKWREQSKRQADEFLIRSEHWEQLSRALTERVYREDETVVASGSAFGAILHVSRGALRLQARRALPAGGLAEEEEEEGTAAGFSPVLSERPGYRLAKSWGMDRALAAGLVSASVAGLDESDEEESVKARQQKLAADAARPAEEEEKPLPHPQAATAPTPPTGLFPPSPAAAARAGARGASGTGQTLTPPRRRAEEADGGSKSEEEEDEEGPAQHRDSASTISKISDQARPTARRERVQQQDPTLFSPSRPAAMPCDVELAEVVVHRCGDEPAAVAGLVPKAAAAAAGERHSKPGSGSDEEDDLVSIRIDGEDVLPPRHLQRHRPHWQRRHGRHGRHGSAQVRHEQQLQERRAVVDALRMASASVTDGGRVGEGEEDTFVMSAVDSLGEADNDHRHSTAAAAAAAAAATTTPLTGARASGGLYGTATPSHSRAPTPAPRPVASASDDNPFASGWAADARPPPAPATFAEATAADAAAAPAAQGDGGAELRVRTSSASDASDGGAAGDGEREVCTTLQLVAQRTLVGVEAFLLGHPLACLDLVADGDATVHALDTGMVRRLMRATPSLAASLFRYMAAVLGERVEALEQAMCDRRRERQAVDEWSGDVLTRLLDGLPVKQAAPAGFAARRELHARLRARFGLDRDVVVVREFERVTLRVGQQAQEARRGTLFLTQEHVCFEEEPRMLGLAGGQWHKCTHFDDVAAIATSYEGHLLLRTVDEELVLRFPRSKQRELAQQACTALWEATFTPPLALELLPYLPLDAGQRRQVLDALRMNRQRARDLKRVLSPADVRRIFHGCKAVGLPRNMTVVRDAEGDASPLQDGVYVLQEGRLRVQRRVGSGRVVFHRVRAGDLFGFDSFFTRAPPTSCIKVDSASAVVCYVSRARLVAVLRNDPSLAERFFHHIALAYLERCMDPLALSARPAMDDEREMSVRSGQDGMCVVL